MYEQHDLLGLRRDLPALNLAEGDVGTVEGVYRPGGYEVELAAPEGGETPAVVTLAEGDLRCREPHEILPVRPVARSTG